MKEPESFIAIYENVANNSNALEQLIQTLIFVACDTVRE